jgi:hypothetical protein
MELKKFRPEEVVVGAICDMCGQSCAHKKGHRQNDPDGTDFCHEYGTLSANWGYWSDGRDLTQEECHLCETCFGKVRDFIRSQGGKVRVIEVSAFESTGPNWRKRSGHDYVRLPGMSVPCMLRQEILNDLDEIKRVEDAKEHREQEEARQHQEEGQ